jgi:RNA polymerase sigma-70 factor (ECF subfamily)
MSAFRVVANDESEGERVENALDARSLPIEMRAGKCDTALADAAKVDPHAFGELYERYYARVYRYVFHRLANPTDAEDITALVFMKALEALPSYQSRRNTFAPWLFRITRNAVIDHYRRRRFQTSIDDLEHHSSEFDPAGHVLNCERSEELAALVRHLSDEQRDVVLLRFAGDLSFAEIGAVLKKNEPAVRMLLHRGLRKMKTVMEDA